MLREFWNVIKSFKKRFVLYYLVVLAMTLFGTFPLMSIKLGAFVVFIVACAFFLPVAASQFISTIRQFAVHGGRVKLPVSAEVTDLSKRAGVEVKELGIVRGNNAYVLGKSLVLGMALLEKLSFNERQAVVAHELVHIKRKHVVIRSVWVAILSNVLMLSWSKLYSPIFFSESITQIILMVMLNISVLAFLFLVMIPINWYIEQDADRFAAKLVGKEYIKSALLKFADEKNFEEPSETHPSIAERVKRIDKLID
jgi:Zn-dependent protease with chaperone function